MQSTKKLTGVLRDLVALLEEEAARNPDFAGRLETILATLPPRDRKAPRSARPTADVANVPDVFLELQNKGETELRFWLRSLDTATLKAIIKINGFDPAKASKRWTDPDKFVALVADQTIARMKRGSAFLPAKTDNIAGNLNDEDAT
jgi:hypothetical protein